MQRLDPLHKPPKSAWPVSFPINWVWNPCPVVSGAEERPNRDTSQLIHPVPQRFMLTEVHNTDNSVKTVVKQGSGDAAAAVESAFIPWITPPAVLPHPGTPFLSPQGATTGGASSLLAGVGAERGAYPSFLRSTIAS